MSNRIDTILSVENIEVKAQHGWYAQERVLGGVYIINVHFEHNIDISEAFNEISSTINYEIIHDKVISVMKEEHTLIEQCCKAIFDKLKALSKSGVWTVELIKKSPPMKNVGRTKYQIKG